MRWTRQHYPCMHGWNRRKKRKMWGGTRRCAMDQEDDPSSFSTPPTQPAHVQVPIHEVHVGKEEEDASGTSKRIQRNKWMGWMPTLVLLGCAATTVAGVGLMDDTEPLFAEAARQMRITGDWITPQFNGQTRFDKPPLLYWTLSWFVTKPATCTWTLRIPSMICAVVTAVATQRIVGEFGTHVPKQNESKSNPYLRSKKRRTEHEREVNVNQTKGIAMVETDTVLTKHAHTEDIEDTHSTDAIAPTTTGIMAALAFATNIGQVIWGSAVLSDMLLVCTYSLCTLFVFKGYVASTPKEPQPKYFLMAAAMGGLAILTKGPVGILLPTIASITFLGWTGELWSFARWEMPWVRALGICLAIGTPWFAAMYARHGAQYLNTFFGYHNFERYATGVNWHGGRPWWYSLAIVFLLYSPWTASAVRAVLASKPWNRTQWKSMPRKERLLLFCVCWLLSAFALFAFSASQLPSYYLPCAVPVAILAAHGSSRTKVDSSFFVPLVTFLVASAAVLFAPSLLVRSADAATASLGGNLARATILKWGPLLACLSSMILYLGGESRILGFPKAFAGSLVGFLFLVVTVVGPSLRIIDSSRQAPLRELSSVASSVRRKGEPLVMVGPCMPSVVYYTQGPVAFFDVYKEAVQKVDISCAEGRLTSALILVDEQQINRVKPGTSKELGRSGGYVLLRRVTSQA
mmetsp:Transcript_8261/g.51428  ORF Transcript_8261/g.51428 Transcript_8261/m.51428 type:complete len:689 (+) Transcript_8261:200-2266(+)